GAGARDREAGTRQRGAALLHEAALGRQRQDELARHRPSRRPSHRPASCSASRAASSRSVWIEAPTAGPGPGAPTPPRRRAYRPPPATGLLEPSLGAMTSNTKPV